jgi:hypothetical protein
VGAAEIIVFQCDHRRGNFRIGIYFHFFRVDPDKIS